MNKLKLLAALVLLNAMTSPSALAYPTCTSAASDPDGDGWGWENNQSCQVSTSGSTTPTCNSAASDPDGDGWGWENNASCKVSTSSSGGSTSSGSTTTNPSYPVCASASSDPDGDGWGWENNASCKVSSSGSSGSGSSGSGDMYVQNGKLYSPSGNAFVPRGINLQYGDNPASALPAITPIANTGANIVRLQLRKTTTAAQLRSALDAIVAKNMVAMPMYWESDVTCQSSSSPLLTAVSSLWLGSWKSVLQDSKYRGKILLNVANEWGEDTNNYADYLSTYKSVIQSLRSGGYTMPLVIDAAHCGQYADSFLSGRGTQLLNADSKKNLVFSVHAYHWKWDTHAEIDSAITALKAQNLAFLFGEFGDSHFQAPNNIDHYYLLNKTQDESVGWIAWSWKGNGSGEEEILDMSYSYNSINLTTHGNDIVYGEDGLKQTSVLLK